MNTCLHFYFQWRSWPVLAIVLLMAVHPWSLQGQEAEAKSLLKRDSAYISVDSIYANSIGGEFTPSRGFDVFKSKYASLNISVYGLARYINQLPGEQSYTDNRDSLRYVDPRQDVQWHRTLAWFSGFFLTPKFRYTITVWGLASTQQTLFFGNFQYTFSPALRAGVGIGPNMGIRALQFQWPFFHGSDRQMVEEFIRPGFTGSFWLTGEALPKFYYVVNVGNNLSQLGISSANLTRSMSLSGSVWWLPTTGEFGPRAGNNDLEKHQRLATRFGASFCQNRENRSNQIENASPLSTQIRMSDGVLLFETGALAPGITIREADYLLFAVDAGFKYKGWHLQLEGFYRNLSAFDAVNSGGEAAALPYRSLTDVAFNGSLSYPVIHNRVVAYGVVGLVFDEFDRKPWEVSGGLSYYPSGTRTWRLNAHVIRVFKSPASSQFGYYIAGQNGTTFSIGTDLLL